LSAPIFIASSNNWVCKPAARRKKRDAIGASMNILILGAGQVGLSVAENLLSESNDITLVDTDTRLLEGLRDRLEVRTIQGNGASPAILEEAGAASADLLVALTRSDETNLCACRIAKTLFNVPRRIARLRKLDFGRYPQLLDEHHFAVTQALCPERIITDALLRLLSLPDSIEVMDFPETGMQIIGMRAKEKAPWTGLPLKTLPSLMPSGVELRIPVLYRNGQPIFPKAKTMVAPGDELFCVAESRHMPSIMRSFSGIKAAVRKIFIGGGGEVGSRLAAAVAMTHDVHLIEREPKKAEFLSQSLPSSVKLIQADVTDELLLEREGVRQADFFFALTDDEEDNIMSCSLAKRLGAKRTLALIKRKTYADLVQGGPIDVAISPALTSIASLLSHVRQHDALSVGLLRRGRAEVLEFGTEPARASRVLGRPIEEITLPRGCAVAGLVRPCGRGFSLVMPHHNTVIEPGDRVFIFSTEPRQGPKLQSLFATGRQRA
jgi:trk system potassium uptake protein